MFVERKETGKPGEFGGLTIAEKRDRIMSIASQLGLSRVSEDGRRGSGSYLTVPEPSDVGHE